MKTDRLPRAVVMLGVVSLATDAATEMIYPLLPIFLTTVLHAGPTFVGAVEGVADGLSSLLKLVSGRLADAATHKKPLTLAGYAISTVLRPLIGFATAPWMVLAVRAGDRIGKGVRSSPRDALLVEVTPPLQRGRAFGLHRAMDNAGAVVGPLLAFTLLAAGVPLRHVFILSIVPGLIALLALGIGVREPDNLLPPTANATKANGNSLHHPALRAYLVAVGIFSFGNASDAFLLLRARSLGVEASHLPLLWMLHNGLRAALSTAGGALSDRFGRTRLILAGWILFALVYLAFGFAVEAWQIWILFSIYSIYYALVEGSERALVADLAGQGARGRAFGAFHAIVGLSALPASLLFGILVEKYGARVPFTSSAALALVAAMVLSYSVRLPREARG